MITAIKVDDTYSRLIKYILLDEEKKNCLVIKASNPDEEKLGKYMEDLKNILADGYRLIVMDGISRDKEIHFLWPHLTEIIQDKYPYINGFLERARLELKENRLLIEVETNLAYKYLNEEKVRKFIEKELFALLDEEIVLEIKNGDLLKDIPLEPDREDLKEKILNGKRKRRLKGLPEIMMV